MNSARPSCAMLTTDDLLDERDAIIARLQAELDTGKSMYGRAMVVFAEERDKLQAELDAARKERDEERNAHAELQARCYDYGGTGQNVFSDLANLRAVNEQYVNMDSLKDSQLAALRTRLESVLDRGAKFQLAIHRARRYVTTEVAGNLIDDALAALAAIDTAATQGGAK